MKPSTLRPLGLVALPMLAACNALFGIEQRQLEMDAASDAGNAIDTEAGGDTEADARSAPDAPLPTDADGDADAYVPDPHWTPASLTGLVLWLDATWSLAASDGGPRDGGITWLDRSGAGNDATAIGSATFATAALNGRDAAHFDGFGYFAVADAPTLRFGKGDYYIAIVAKHTTPTNAGKWGYGTLFGKHSVTAGLRDGVIVTANAPPLSGPATPPESTSHLISQVAWGDWVRSADSGFNSGKPFLVTTHRSTVQGQTTLTLRTNAAESASETSSNVTVDVSAFGRALTIGGSDEVQNIIGDIAEVLAVNGPPSASDETNIEAYLMRKYGL